VKKGPQRREKKAKERRAKIKKEKKTAWTRTLESAPGFVLKNAGVVQRDGGGEEPVVALLQT